MLCLSAMKLLSSSSDPREVKGLYVVIWLLLAGTATAAQAKLDSLGACARIYRNVTVLGFRTTATSTSPTKAA
jgi:hypothetical protein